MISVIDAQYETLFEHFEYTNFNRPIVDDNFRKLKDKIHEQNFKQSKILTSYVANSCDRSLDVTLNAKWPHHGLESRQRLRERFDHRSKVGSGNERQV